MALPPGYGLHPDAPIISSVSPVAGTNDRLEVFFTLAEYEGAGGSIDRVEVRFNDQTSHTDSPTNGSLTITGLTAGAKYEFRARSRNTNKLWSDESNLISGTVPLIGSPAPAQNESESECRFRYGRVGRVCNTVAKPQETADGVRLHMIHDLDLPTDMTAREFSSLDVPTFSDAVLLTTESDLFLARDGVEVVTGETPARQFGIACEGNEYARTLSYDFQTPALKDIFMSSPNNPILSRIRARVFDSGVNEGSLIFLRLDIKHGGTGPQLSSPISKWRIVFRFDDDDAKTFAVSIGDDITEPYFWRTADFSNFPAGMLAAFSRAQSAIKGGGAVESLKVALVDTTAWTNGSDWRKAFEINDNNGKFNGVRASKSIAGLETDSPITVGGGDIAVAMELPAPVGLFSGSPANPIIRSVGIRPTIDNSRIRIHLNNAVRDDVSAFTFVLHVNRRIFLFSGNSANTTALSNAIQFQHGINSIWDEFIDNGEFAVESIGRAPTAISIGLAVVETNLWPLEDAWGHAFHVGKTLTAEDVAFPLTDLLGVKEVRLGYDSTLRRSAGLPAAGKEYAYHEPSKTLIFHKDDLPSLFNLTIVLVRRKSDDPFITIPTESFYAPTPAHDMSNVEVFGKKTSVTVCYDADPTARNTWKTPTEWHQSTEDAFQLLGLDPDKYLVQKQCRPLGEDGMEGAWADVEPVAASAVAVESVPLPPPIVEARALSQTRLFVSWRESPAPGSSPVYAYRLRYRQGDSPWVSRDYSQNVLQDNVSNLIPDRIYEFQIQAVNSEGASEWSESVFWRTIIGSAPDAPDAPDANIVGDVRNFDQEFRTGDFDVRVDWTAPNDNGFPILEHQLLRYQPGTNTKPYAKYSIGIGEPLHCVFSYENGVVDEGYRYKVRAKNIVGWGDWSDWGVARGLEAPISEAPEYKTFIYGIYAARGGDGSEQPRTFNSESIVFLDEGGQPLRDPGNIIRNARSLQMGSYSYGWYHKIRTGDDIASYVESLIDDETQSRIAETLRKLTDANTAERAARSRKYLTADKRATSEPSVDGDGKKSVPLEDADVPNGVAVDVVDVLDVEKAGESYQRVSSRESLSAPNQFYFDAAANVVLFHSSASVLNANITFRHRAEPAADDTSGKERLETARADINSAKAEIDELRKELKDLRGGRMTPETPLTLTWEFARNRSVTWQVAYFDMSNVNNRESGNSENYILAVFAETNDGDGAYRAADNAERASLVLQERNVTASEGWWNFLESFYGGSDHAGATSKQGAQFTFTYGGDAAMPLWLSAFKSHGGYSYPKLRPFGNAPIEYTITADGFSIPVDGVTSSALVTVYQGSSANRLYWSHNFDKKLQRGQFRFAPKKKKVYFHEDDIGQTVKMEYAQQLRIIDGNIIDILAATGSARTHTVEALGADDRVYLSHSDSGASFDAAAKNTAGEVTADGNWHLGGTTLTYRTDTKGTISVIYAHVGQAAVSYRSLSRVTIVLDDPSAYYHIKALHRIKFEPLEDFLNSNLLVSDKS